MPPKPAPEAMQAFLLDRLDRAGNAIDLFVRVLAMPFAGAEDQPDPSRGHRVFPLSMAVAGG